MSGWAIKNQHAILRDDLDRKSVMREAASMAQIAATQGEVPVGAILYVGKKLIASSFNQTNQLKDPTAHAEILVLRAAAKKLGNYRLNDGVLFTTLEPCPMCAGAVLESRIKSLIFGAYDRKNGAAGSVYNIVAKNPNIEIVGGVEEYLCSSLLTKFFKAKRN